MSTSSGNPEPPEQSAPTPAGPDPEAEPDISESDTPAAEAPEPRTPAEPRTPETTEPAAPSPRRKRRRLLAAGAGTLALLLAIGSGAAWWAYHRLDSNIRTDSATTRILQREESARPTRNPDPKTYNAKNILLIGSDDRSGSNARYGAAGGQRSDTTILLHLSADRRRAVAVSIPRDAMVQVPSCEKADGTRTRPQLVQFNWSFEFGGAACTIRTVEDLTGIRIDHHLIVDFAGFKTMVDAVGGVDVCLAQDVHDTKAKLDLTAGPHTLHGEQALGFVRLRHGIGDSSDTQRMGRQQQFLASLAKKVQTDGVLLNPAKLWPLLNAATSAITTDPGLSSLSDLYDLAQSLRSIPPESMVFLTAPRRPYPPDHNRDELVQPQADMLFKALSEDQPVQIVDSSTTAAVSEQIQASPSPSGSAAAPDAPLTFVGRTADQEICGR